MHKCSGPCLPNCSKCGWKTVLMARVSFVYVVASLVYLVATRCVGTPFRDSLSEEQKRIKSCSAKKRGLVFLIGAVIGVGIVVATKPFVKE